MPKRTCVVTLDDIDFTIPALNMEQLERASIAAGTKTQTEAGFAVLRIALERAEPKVVDPENFSPTPDQIKAAMDSIMTLSGLVKEGDAGSGNPPGGQAPAS